MKIAFTTKGKEWDSKMDPRFGRTEFIFLYDEETKEITTADNRDIEGVAHGAGPQTAKLIFDLNPDVLITGNGPGGNAARVLEKANIDIYTGAGELSVDEAYESYLNDKLTKF